ncbi:MAG: protein kinase [Myxococcaceae bacterium]
MKWTTDEFTGKRFGKYEVLCRLAIGGMAEIFLGFARSGPFVGRPVVIKRILNEQREDPNAMQMLLDEAKNTATLMHPNVAQVMDLETADDEVLLVIEFITGANIEELVEVYTARQEPLPLGFAITVVREAAQGLGHAHAHKNSRGELLPIIHRDVTPRNVMCDFDGQIKVLDFGIARAKGSERRTQAGMVRGTTAYMSPEQAVGKELDPRTDLFSLGIIFHELLTGQRLFYKGNPGQEMAAVYEGEIPLPSKANRRVPRQLDAVVMRLLERKLDKRYQTAGEMVRDLALAAGSTAWGRDRCAELLRTSFSARQADVEKLIARIPNRAPPAALGGGPAYPEGRTMIQKGPIPQQLQDADDSGARTLVGAQPLVGPRAGIPMATEPGREPATDPGRPAVVPAPYPGAASPNYPGSTPVAYPGGGYPGSSPSQLGIKQATPQPQPPTKPSNPNLASGLSADQLFDDDEPPSEERTRIIPGQSMRSLPRVDNNAAPPASSGTGDVPIAERQTDPRRQSVSRPKAGGSSSGTMIVAAVIALILGAVGGAFVIQKLQEKKQPPTALLRLTISTDRPATVSFDKQVLGGSPVTAFVPSGHHVIEFTEEGGAKRVLDITLPATDPEPKLPVVLDSLPEAPAAP